MELKNRVVSGVAWTATEKFGSTLLQLCVSIIIARLLDPTDFGLIAMLTVFTMISNSIIDSGFTIALIRKPKPTTEDYSSVFYFNTVVSILLYVLLCALSYPISRFYNEPDLVRFAPFVFAIIPVNAMGIIQGAILQKQMDFRKIAAQNLIAAIVSGTVSIYMAYTGWGVWALVFQMISMSVVRVGIMWLRGNWRPLAKFSLAPIREFWSYSSRMFLNSLLNTTFNNISQLFIGKFYNPVQLGLYYQAQKLRDLPLMSISYAIISVSLPAFSSLQHDVEKLREASRKVMITMAFIIYPIMVGLIATAPEIFSIVLTDKWLAAVPYFQILCLSSLLIPVSDTYLNILIIKATGDKVLRIALLRRAFAVLVLAVTIPISVRAIAWGQVIYMAFDTLAYAYFSKRYIGTSVTRHIKEILPYLALTAAMYGVVVLVGYIFSNAGQTAVLLAKIGTGAVVYVGLAHLLRLEAWRDTKEIIQNMLRKLIS